jgi:hypothetical protein
MSSFTPKGPSATLTVRVPASVVGRINTLRQQAEQAGYRLNLNEILTREIEKIVGRLEKEAANLKPTS